MNFASRDQGPANPSQIRSRQIQFPRSPRPPRSFSRDRKNQRQLFNPALNQGCFSGGVPRKTPSPAIFSAESTNQNPREIFVRSGVAPAGEGHIAKRPDRLAVESGEGGLAALADADQREAQAGVGGGGGGGGAGGGAGDRDGSGGDGGGFQEITEGGEWGGYGNRRGWGNYFSAGFAAAFCVRSAGPASGLERPGHG